MKLNTIKWIEAAKILSVNPNLNILCPECEKQNLNVLDEINETNPTVSERYLFCNACGSRNILKVNDDIGITKDDVFFFELGKCIRSPLLERYVGDLIYIFRTEMIG